MTEQKNLDFITKKSVLTIVAFIMILTGEGDHTAYHIHNFFCGYSKSFETF